MTLFSESLAEFIGKSSLNVLMKCFLSYNTTEFWIVCFSRLVVNCSFQIENDWHRKYCTWNEVFLPQSTTDYFCGKYTKLMCMKWNLFRKCISHSLLDMTNAFLLFHFNKLLSPFWNSYSHCHHKTQCTLGCIFQQTWNMCSALSGSKTGTGPQNFALHLTCSALSLTKDFFMKRLSCLHRYCSNTAITWWVTSPLPCNITWIATSNFSCCRWSSLAFEFTS